MGVLKQLYFRTKRTASDQVERWSYQREQRNYLQWSPSSLFKRCHHSVRHKYVSRISSDFDNRAGDRFHFSGLHSNGSGVLPTVSLLLKQHQRKHLPIRSPKVSRPHQKVDHQNLHLRSSHYLHFFSTAMNFCWIDPWRHDDGVVYIVY